MDKISDSQKILLTHVCRQLLPWAGSGALQLVLAQPPFRVPKTIPLQQIQSPLLPNKTKVAVNVLNITRWPSSFMNAHVYPVLCCVLEGQVDWSVGITRRMIQLSPELDARYGQTVLRVPAQSALLMPPGVPFGDGQLPHWHGPPDEIPDSLLFWIICNPQGADLHLCRTRQGVHESLCPAFIQDTQTLRVAELLLEELQESAPRVTPESQHYLEVLLLRVSGALRAGKGLNLLQQVPARTDELETTTGSGGETLLFERACRFIENQLVTPLNVQRIASHLYVSASHLNRVFQRQAGVSPMQYVAKRRMEIARSLLAETSYSIHYISDFLGYSQRDVFSRAFRAESGVSPAEYRRDARSN